MTNAASRRHGYRGDRSSSRRRRAARADGARAMKFPLRVLVVAAFGSLVASAQERPSSVDELEKFKSVLRDATSNVENFETNGFRVESELAQELGADLKPTGKEMAFLNVTADGIFRVVVEKG